jgi:LmbE family N-acetylglucosaminyl deacetylase
VQDTRRAEDEAAARHLGCTLRWLGYPDAIYRGERYAGDGALYAAPHPEEQALPAYLAEELRHLPEWQPAAVVAVPLGIGRHVDHQLVFEAGAVLAAAGVEVWAYEDLPYAIHTPGSLPERLAQLHGRLGEEQRVAIDATMETKLDAVASYGTQVPVIFRFTDDFRGALRQHALAVGNGRACERYWRVLPA